MRAAVFEEPRPPPALRVVERGTPPPRAGGGRAGFWRPKVLCWGAGVCEGPGPAAVLGMVEGEPPPAGAGEVRVRIVLSAVNPTDTGTRAGRGVPDGVAPPRVPNQDGAGVV